MKDKFLDIIDPYDNVILRENEDGSRLEASWADVESMIITDPKDGLWADIIKKWNEEGRI